MPAATCLLLLSGSALTSHAQYCTPASTYTNRYINNFSTTLGATNISNLNSGFSTGGYGNFSATQVVTTTPGGSFNFSISFDGSPHALKIWVDWNHDNDFNDPGETVFTSTSTSGATSYTGTITVPASATAMTTRMRAGSQRTPITPPTDACMTVSFGEYEDYAVTITGGSTPTCAAPTAPTATAITTTTASLNWTQTGTPPQWQIRYGPTGFPLATGGTTIPTPTKPYTLNPPLTPNTTYDYYVRSICGAGDTSAWSPVTTFTTACIPPTISTKTDSFRCGPGTVVLRATSSAGSIKWYTALTGGTAVATGNTYTTPSLTTTTTYYITAASGTCESSPRQAITATIRPVPVVNIGNDTTICPGVSYTLNAGNAGATYLWNTNAVTQSITVNQAGNYSVLVTLNGCSNSDARLITDGQVPQRTLPAAIDLCQGDITTLNAGNTGSSYVWSPGGQTTQTVNVSTGGIHAVAIKSTTGCVTRDSTQVVMRPLPVVNLGNDIAICIGASVTLDAGASPHSYLWSPTGDTTQTITISDSGAYSVRITTAFHCQKTDTVHVAYRPAVRIGGFNFIPLFYENLGKVRFEPLNPIAVTGYLWDFGDGTATSTEVRPTHTYATTGHYTVTLTVSGDCGRDTTRLPIHVDLATGIAGPDQPEQVIVLYPNPAREALTLECLSPGLKAEEVVIYNTLGAVVYRKAIRNAKELIGTTQLATGSYMIRVATNKGIITRKFEVIR